MMATALGVPIAVMDTAGEGGAWGMALLASYMLTKSEDESLAAFLSERVFADQNSTTIKPDPQDIDGFMAFMERYKMGLSIERAAVETLSGPGF